MLVVITLANLRGTKDASWAFALPTYLFIGSLGMVLAMGIVKVINCEGGHPESLIAPPGIPRATEAVSLWILLGSLCQWLHGHDGRGSGEQRGQRSSRIPR